MSAKNSGQCAFDIDQRWSRAKVLKTFYLILAQILVGKYHWL